MSILILMKYLIQPLSMRCMKEGTNRRNVQFQDFELVVKQNTEIRNQIVDIVSSGDVEKESRSKKLMFIQWANALIGVILRFMFT